MSWRACWLLHFSLPSHAPSPLTRRFSWRSWERVRRANCGRSAQSPSGEKHYRAVVAPPYRRHQRRLPDDVLVWQFTLVDRSCSRNQTTDPSRAERSVDAIDRRRLRRRSIHCHPATLSASAIVPPTARQLVITPSAINSPMRVGRSRILTVRAVDRLGNAVRRAAIPVALGQVVYGQHALIPGEASIDGRPEGETPVLGHTDRSGRVQFTIRGIQAQSDPVFFQAWIAPRDRAPSGFSNLVSILFVDR